MSLRIQIDSLKQIRIGRAGTPVFPSTAYVPPAQWSDGRPRLSKRMLQFSAVFFLLIIFMGAGDESARVNDLGHRMMCVCGCNQILLECNHVGCAYSTRMRNELAAALDRGDNDDLVLQSFVQKYGTVVIAAPTTKGFNRVAWIMPYLALVLGIGGVVLIVRTWRGRPLLLPAGSVKPVHGTELDHFRAQAKKETEDV